MSDAYFTAGLIAVMMPSLVLHEIAHAWTADLFGDPTARRAGRITLNPLRHIHPFGTVVLPIVLALVAPFVIGFAKPVPVVLSNLRNPRLHSLIVALAGPISNFSLAGAALIVFQVFRPDRYSFVWHMLALVTVVNVVLALFNLLPIPPLDGSAIIDFLVPSRFRRTWFGIRNYGFFVLLVVMFWFRSSLDPLVQWAVDVWQAQQ